MNEFFCFLLLLTFCGHKPYHTHIPWVGANVIHKMIIFINEGKNF